MKFTLEMIKTWRHTAHMEHRLEIETVLKAEDAEVAHRAKLRADAWLVIRDRLDLLMADYRVLEAL